jgi:hypothetical protein
MGKLKNHVAQVVSVYSLERYSKDDFSGILTFQSVVPIITQEAQDGEFLAMLPKLFY